MPKHSEDAPIRRWWELSEWCPHWWKTLEPQVKRCRLCRCIQFDAATMEQLQRWLSDG